jgi:hypothetical protein
MEEKVNHMTRALIYRRKGKYHSTSMAELVHRWICLFGEPAWYCFVDVGV